MRSECGSFGTDAGSIFKVQQEDFDLDELVTETTKHTPLRMQFLLKLMEPTLVIVGKNYVLLLLLQQLLLVRFNFKSKRFELCRSMKSVATSLQ